MSAVVQNYQLTGLTKRKSLAFLERAKQLGMTPQRYLKHLVEEDLAISSHAKSATFEQLLPAADTDEDEIDRLVVGARRRLTDSVGK